MKKFFASLCLMVAAVTAGAQVKVNKIEPTNWFVGMKNPSLQLMVYGEGIAKADVTTDYTGVKVDSIVRPGSDNYLLVYLNIKDAKPGKMTLKFANGKKSKKVDYELLQREMAGSERIGFDINDVLYMLMPDRFADGDESNNQIKGMNEYKCDRTQPSLRHGGDLEGIRQHLDYFNELGVTTLWFTPVLENNSADENGVQSTYHGYATTDYYNVDPRFGTNADYRRLADEAHAKGIKIVMDMIFNHCGEFHPWLKDMPSKDWFNEPDYKNNYLQTSYKLTPVMDPYASEIDMRETVDGWFVPSMPDLNQRNPHVIKYLIQNSKWWIETIGINGIRMDTYPYADAQAMADWMKELDEEYPNFNVVGETWVTEPAYTASWQKDSPLNPINSYLKTVMDFSFYEKMGMAKNEETDTWWQGFNRLYNSFVYDYLYVNPSCVMTFIENHDTDRFLGNGNDIPALKQALSLLLTVNRIPQLYYGTEVLMNGTKNVTDGNVRKDFPGGFKGDAKNAFTKEGRTAEQNEMFSWLSKILHWRQGNEVITKGKMTQFTPFNGIYVVARRYNGKTVMTVLNGTTKPATFSAKRYSELYSCCATATDVTSGKSYNLAEDFTMAPREALILEIK